MHILRTLTRPLILLMRLLLRPLHEWRRRTLLRRSDGWIELVLDGDVRELGGGPRLPLLLRRILRRPEPPRVDLGELRRIVDEIKKDRLAQGMLVRLGSIGGGWATASTLRELLKSVRTAERTVVVHAKSHLGNREALVASGGSRLVMTPPGVFAAVGASSRGLFFRSALERFGIVVEASAEGRYKSAPERFTRDARSDADREQMRALVDALDEHLVASWGEFRGLDGTSAQAQIDRVPMVGQRALEAGLCDAIARETEIVDELHRKSGPPSSLPDTDDKGRVSVSPKTPKEPMGAHEYFAARALLPIALRRRKLVGVVEVHGAIVDAPPSLPFVRADAAWERRVVNDLRAAGEDSSIGAVVLHIDSRGGSVTASDAIFAAARRLDKEKPVIACLGDMAASGGYYVACGARAIVCAPMTITGSIGVFAMAPFFEDLLEKLGIGYDRLSNRHNATLGDPFVRPTDADRAHAQQEVAALYALFIGLVSDARGIDKERVEALAGGRVWTGRQAFEGGLVDSLDGMPDAIERATRAAGARFHPEPVLVHSRSDVKRPEVQAREARAREIEASMRSASAASLSTLVSNDPVISEILTLLSRDRGFSYLAWAPVDVP